MYRSSRSVSQSLQVLRSRPCPRLRLALRSSNLHRHNTTNATAKADGHYPGDNTRNTVNTEIASSIGTNKTSIESISDVDTNRRLTEPALDAGTRETTRDYVKLSSEATKLRVFNLLYGLIIAGGVLWGMLYTPDCPMYDLRSALESDPSNVDEFTKKLHRTLRVLATANPHAEQLIDAVFKDINAMRQKYRPRYDEIHERLTRDLVKANKLGYGGHTTYKHSDQARQELAVLRDFVISDIQAKYPKLKEMIDGFRTGVARTCSPRRRKFILEVIPEGNQVMMLLAKLILLPAPVAETAEEKLHKAKLSEADRQLKQYLDSLTRTGKLRLDGGSI